MIKKKILVIGCILVITFGLGVITTLTYAQDEVIPFIVATSEGPGELDPLDAYDSESIETIMQVCEGLYKYNYSSREMESIPCLAASMGTWSVDTKNLTIALKQGAYFHDESKFNASAVKWNFDRLQYWTYGFDIDNDGDLDIHPLGTASKTLFEQDGTPILNHTEIVDEYTVKFVLNLPSVIWEKLLAFIACAIVLPDKDYELGSTFLNRIDINDELIGTGPFILNDYVFDNQVVFDYNPDYHMAWGANHIERMIYLIIPDAVTSSLAVLNHEVHWGGVLRDYQDYFDKDPELINIRRKASVVYYFEINLQKTPFSIRKATQYCWNHTNWLENTLGGRHYKLHSPIPDGMQYHHHGYDGDIFMNISRAREYILNSTDPGLAANVTFSGLTLSSDDSEWIAIAESSSALGWYDFISYRSSTVFAALEQLTNNLKQVGIRLENYTIDWSNWCGGSWCGDWWDEPDYSKYSFSFGGWGPDYNDPINMIEPMYRTDASSNKFGNSDLYLDSLMDLTYNTTGTERGELFYEIQEYFIDELVPAINIVQLGGSLSFNRLYLDEDSIGDLTNLFSDLYWLNVKFTPPEKPKPVLFVVTISIISAVIGLCILANIYIHKKRKG